MKRLFIAVVLFIGITSPALAKHCPNDHKIINQALAKAVGLTKMQKTEVNALHDKGVAFHKSGKHGEAIKALHAATKILGVKPYKPM